MCIRDRYLDGIYFANLTPGTATTKLPIWPEADGNNYALSRNRGNEYSWKAELNVNYTKQDYEYLMPNSVQNAENLSLGLGGKKNFVLGNSLNRRRLIDVHVAYNLSLIHI